MQTLEDDYIEELLMTTTHHYLMFFTNTGRVYRLKAYEIPEAGRTARGTAIINLLQLMPGECITAVIPLRKFEDGHYLMMATKNGLVKKTPIKEYANVRKNGLAAITLRDDDELIEVKLTDDKKDIILVTKDGMCIRFKETDVRSTGRTSMGVRGMNIDDGDEVVAMQLNSQGDCLLIVSANGMGKRTSMGEFTCQNRGGKGVKCYKITEKTGDVIGARAVNEDNEVVLKKNTKHIQKVSKPKIHYTRKKNKVQIWSEDKIEYVLVNGKRVQIEKDVVGHDFVEISLKKKKTSIEIKTKHRKVLKKEEIKRSVVRITSIQKIRMWLKQIFKL